MMTLGVAILIVLAFTAGALIGLWVARTFPRKH